MAEEITSTEVYRPDLESLVETLDTVYHFCLSYDLFNQYKNLSNKVSPSPLTKAISIQRNRFQGVLDMMDLPSETPEPADVS